MKYELIKSPSGLKTGCEEEKKNDVIVKRENTNDKRNYNNTKDIDNIPFLDWITSEEVNANVTSTSTKVFRNQKFNIDVCQNIDTVYDNITMNCKERKSNEQHIKGANNEIVYTKPIKPKYCKRSRAEAINNDNNRQTVENENEESVCVGKKSVQEVAKVKTTTATTATTTRQKCEATKKKINEHFSPNRKEISENDDECILTTNEFCVSSSNKQQCETLFSSSSELEATALPSLHNIENSDMDCCYNSKCKSNLSAIINAFGWEVCETKSETLACTLEDKNKRKGHQLKWTFTLRHRVSQDKLTLEIITLAKMTRKTSLNERDLIFNAISEGRIMSRNASTNEEDTYNQQQQFIEDNYTENDSNNSSSNNRNMINVNSYDSDYTEYSFSHIHSINGRRFACERDAVLFLLTLSLSAMTARHEEGKHSDNNEETTKLVYDDKEKEEEERNNRHVNENNISSPFTTIFEECREVSGHNETKPKNQANNITHGKELNTTTTNEAKKEQKLQYLETINIYREHNIGKDERSVEEHKSDKETKVIMKNTKEEEKLIEKSSRKELETQLTSTSTSLRVPESEFMPHDNTKTQVKKVRTIEDISSADQKKGKQNEQICEQEYHVVETALPNDGVTRGAKATTIVNDRTKQGVWLSSRLSSLSSSSLSKELSGKPEKTKLQKNRQSSDNNNDNNNNNNSSSNNNKNKNNYAKNKKSKKWKQQELVYSGHGLRPLETITTLSNLTFATENLIESNLANMTNEQVTCNDTLSKKCIIDISREQTPIDDSHTIFNNYETLSASAQYLKYTRFISQEVANLFSLLPLPLHTNHSQNNENNILSSLLEEEMNKKSEELNKGSSSIHNSVVIDTEKICNAETKVDTCAEMMARSVALAVGSSELRGDILHAGVSALTQYCQEVEQREQREYILERLLQQEEEEEQECEKEEYNVIKQNRQTLERRKYSNNYVEESNTDNERNNSSSSSSIIDSTKSDKTPMLSNKIYSINSHNSNDNINCSNSSKLHNYFPWPREHTFLPVHGTLLTALQHNVQYTKDHEREDKRKKIETLPHGIPPAPRITIPRTYHRRHEWLLQMIDDSNKHSNLEELKNNDNNNISNNKNTYEKFQQGVCFVQNPESDIQEYIHRRFIRGEQLTNTSTALCEKLNCTSNENSISYDKEDSKVQKENNKKTVDMDRYLRIMRDKINPVPMPDVEWFYSVLEKDTSTH